MSSTFFRYIKYARPYTRLTVGAIIAGIFKFSLALALPIALGYVIDKALPDIAESGSFSRLWRVLVILAVVFVVRGVMTYYRSILASIASQRVIFDIRRDLFRHIQRLSMTYHAKRRTGETASRLINDLNSAQNLLNEGVIAIAMDLVFLHGVVVFLFIWDWRLATISLFTLPFYGLLFKILNPRLRKAARQVQEEMQEMSGEVTEKLAGLPVVLSHVREKTEERNFFLRHRKYHNRVIHRVRIRMVLTTLAEFLQSFGPVLVISYGAYRVATDPVFTVGQLVTFYGFLSHLYLPTRRLADYGAQTQEHLAALDRVFEVLDTEPDIQDCPDAKPLHSPQGHLSFDHVTFAYDKEHMVLHDIDLDVKPGMSVAFVGRSGAGKTTLISLVPRFYDVTEGAVRIDGIDIRNFTVRSLREHIGIVLQDSILFSGSIRDNILYGRFNATEEQMLDAAHMAHVHEFVDTLPNGYDTLIGERGVSLSGGQKQRLSIARAFLRDPATLILDEATSNLDSGSESKIQDALNVLMQGRTTLVIAHRLSTVVNCDQVVVLDEGRIVQMGPHHELISRKGFYRRLCKEQFGAVQADVLTRRAS